MLLDFRIYCFTLVIRLYTHEKEINKTQKSKLPNPMEQSEAQ